MDHVSAIDAWIRDAQRGDRTFRLKQLYELQAEFLFNQYEPVKASPSEGVQPFLSRLDRWVQSFDDPQDQWAAFSTLQYFFFVGQREVEEMYRCAIHHIVLPWLVECGNIDIFANDADQLIQSELERCWPCPVTDSLRINGFLHRTGFPGQDLRPDWLSLRTLGCVEKINQYASKNNIEYLALFEDFVGSGSQCARAVKFALQAFKGPILLTPLVVCSPGDDVLRKIETGSDGRLRYSPVVVLDSSCLVRPDSNLDEPKSFEALRSAMANGYKAMGLRLSGEQFGFSQVGALYASYSNCPNNTPPIYHATSNAWRNPLFPRERRV